MIEDSENALSLIDAMEFGSVRCLIPDPENTEDSMVFNKELEANSSFSRFLQLLNARMPIDDSLDGK